MVNKIESNLKQSYWALSNMTASPTGANNQNLVLEKFIQLPKDDPFKGRCSIDQLIQ